MPAQRTRPPLPAGTTEPAGNACKWRHACAKQAVCTNEFPVVATAFSSSSSPRRTATLRTRRIDRPSLAPRPPSRCRGRARRRTTGTAPSVSTPRHPARRPRNPERRRPRRRDGPPGGGAGLRLPTERGRCQRSTPLHRDRRGESRHGHGQWPRLRARRRPRHVGRFQRRSTALLRAAPRSAHAHRSLRRRRSVAAAGSAVDGVLPSATSASTRSARASTAVPERASDARLRADRRTRRRLERRWGRRPRARAGPPPYRDDGCRTSLDIEEAVDPADRRTARDGMPAGRRGGGGIGEFDEDPLRGHDADADADADLPARAPPAY